MKRFGVGCCDGGFYFKRVLSLIRFIYGNLDSGGFSRNNLCACGILLVSRGPLLRVNRAI